MQRGRNEITDTQDITVSSRCDCKRKKKNFTVSLDSVLVAIV